MIAKAKPTIWKRLFSFFIAAVWSSSFLLCILLEKWCMLPSRHKAVFSLPLKCWMYLVREQVHAEPTRRCGDPGAIFAYCSSGCSKVSVLPSDSEQQGPGLERVVVNNTYAISLPSQGRDQSTSPKPHQAPGKWVLVLVCHKPRPKYRKRTLSWAKLKELYWHRHICCCLILALFF